MSNKFDVPSLDGINSYLSSGTSYVEAIEQTEHKTFNKYKNFKVITMSSTDKEVKKMMPNDPSKINKDNFVWFNKDRADSLKDMDGDYILTALSHSIGLANRNFEKYNNLLEPYEKMKSKMDHLHNKVSYFMKLAEVLEDEFIDRHGMEVPSKPEEIRALKNMINSKIVILPKNSESFFKNDSDE